MMKKQLLLVAFGIAASLGVNAQTKIKDGTVSSSATPNADAILELESNNKGLLLPRVELQSTTLAAPLSAHTAGITVYNTATVGDVTPGYYYDDGTKWVKLANSDDAGGPWNVQLTTDPATDNAEDIYQMGSVAIGKDSARTGVALEIQGAVRGGNYPANPNDTLAVGVNSAAFGESNIASGQNSFAVGTSNNASGANSVAMGSINTASGPQFSMSLGQGNVVTGNAAALGLSNTVHGDFAFGVGGGNIIDTVGIYSVAFGSANHMSGTYAAAIGTSNDVSGSQAVGFGSRNELSGQYAAAFGDSNLVADTMGMALGKSNIVTGQMSIAAGKDNKDSSDYSYVFGSNNTANGPYSFAVGNGNIVKGSGGIALGTGNTARGGIFSIAMGLSNTVTGNAAALGMSNTVHGDFAFGVGIGNIIDTIGGYAVAFGQGNHISGGLAAAIGAANNLSGFLAVGFGSRNELSGQYAAAFGDSNVVSGKMGMALGQSNFVTDTLSIAGGENSVAAGKYNFNFGLGNISKSINENVLGRYNADTSSTNKEAWVATDNLLQIGNGASATNRSNALSILKDGKVSLGTHTAKPTVSLEINGTDGVKLPSGTTAQRPTAPAFGTLRYNTQTGRPEVYVEDANNDGTLGDAGWVKL